MPPLGLGRMTAGLSTTWPGFWGLGPLSGGYVPGPEADDAAEGPAGVSRAPVEAFQAWKRQVLRLLVVRGCQVVDQRKQPQSKRGAACRPENGPDLDRGPVSADALQPSEARVAGLPGLARNLVVLMVLPASAPCPVCMSRCAPAPSASARTVEARTQRTVPAPIRPWPLELSPCAVEAAGDGLVLAPANIRRGEDETAPPPRVCQRKRCVLPPHPDVGASIASGDGRREQAGGETGERHRPEDVSHC